MPDYRQSSYRGGVSALVSFMNRGIISGLSNVPRLTVDKRELMHCPVAANARGPNPVPEQTPRA